MNLDLVFKILLSIELITIILLFAFDQQRLIRDWRTTLAGLVVIGQQLFTDALYFANAHQLHDIVSLTSFLAVGIALLLAGDGKQDS